MTTIVSFDQLPSLEGVELGASGWLVVSQAMIDQFADATGDHQWIHTDPVRAKDGPFGGPIAHGYLTLSLLIPLWTELFDVEGVTAKVNYGSEQGPVPRAGPGRWLDPPGRVDRQGGAGEQGSADHCGRHRRDREQRQTGLRRPTGVPLLRMTGRAR
jgi:hypothetical protein